MGMVAILLTGIALRAHGLSSLSVTGDEIYTIGEAASYLDAPQDRTEPETWRLRWGLRTNLLLVLVTAAAFDVLGESALAARAFPFLFGLVSLLVLPWMLQRLRGRTAGWTLLVLLTLNPAHIDYSRQARYQSASFLFGGMCLLATLLWVRDRKIGCGVTAVICAALAVASHVTNAALVGGLLLALFTFYRPGWKVFAMLGGLLAAIGIGCFDKIRRTIRVILEGIPRPLGSPPAWRIMVSITYALGPLVVLAAGWQINQFVRRRDRPGLVLCGAVVLGFGALLVLSGNRDVGPRYFASLAAGLLILAALAVSATESTRRRWLRPAWLTGVIVLSQMPTLVSDQIDGQRYDFQAVAEFLGGHASEDDLILASWHANLEFHLGRETEHLDDHFGEVRRTLLTSTAERAYLVILAQRGKLSLPGEGKQLLEWIGPHLLERHSFFHRRLDDRLYRFELVVYEVDAVALRANQ
jgi:hypothetical protein